MNKDIINTPLTPRDLQTVLNAQLETIEANGLIGLYNTAHDWLEIAPEWECESISDLRIAMIKSLAKFADESGAGESFGVFAYKPMGE